MSRKIIPNKLEPLTYFILDNYNTRLQCEGCHKTWTSDGTAFMRDQGGSKGGMYYRQFRCKGKGRGLCTTSYSHEDFLALATRQLGQNKIKEIKQVCGLDDETSKRVRDASPTGLTPPRKRSGALQTPFAPRPVFQLPTQLSPPLPSPHRKPGPFPDRREFHDKRNRSSLHRPLQEVDDAPNELDSESPMLRIRLERAEMMNEMLSEKLVHKQEYIDMLKEQVRLLSRQSLQTVADSPPRTFGESPPPCDSPPRTFGESPPRGESPLPTFGESPPPPTVGESPPPHGPVAPGSRSYVQVVQTPPRSHPAQILRRSPSPPKSPHHRAMLEEKHGLAIVYLTGLKQQKVGQFKKEARENGLSFKSVENISFIGTSIVEILVVRSQSRAFVDKAKSLGFDVSLDLDVTSKSKDNPIWLQYGGEGHGLSDVVKSNFVRRVSHEIKSTNEPTVRRFYLDWAMSLGWKDSLAVSTGLHSP